MKRLKEKVGLLPDLPGVYLMKDAKGRIIYIGKARSLRARVSSYFQMGEHSLKTEALLGRIADFDYILTDSEAEALILEANLVRKHRPRYNVRLTDDKHYPYIHITGEPFPRIEVTRRRKPDGSLYFGAYTSAKSMRKMIKLIRQLFQIRSCKLNLRKRRLARPCVEHDIGLCSAPCTGRISEEEYNRQVKQAVRFLRGRRKDILSSLRKRMNEASARLDFESAATLRDEIQAIEKATESQKLDLEDFEDRDYVGLFVLGDKAYATVFLIREGNAVGRESFLLNFPQNTDDRELLSSFLEQYYSKGDDPPHFIYIGCDIEEKEVFEKSISKNLECSVKIITPERGFHKKLLDMATKNAEYLLNQYIIEREKSRISGVLLSLQKELHLPRIPVVIEGFDISNIGEKASVGSMVQFKNGRPLKSNYRHFRIKETPDVQDDFAKMNEVVYRRYKRLLDEGKPLPDLVLIDGGKGQLTAAYEALKNLGLEEKLPVASLAKRLEEVYLPGIPDPQNIPKSSPSLKLLQRIRDEAHRFAIAYHRKLRKKRSFSSVLTDVPGIGKLRAKRLLTEFTSLDELKKSSPDRISEKAGIPLSVAKKLLLHLGNSIGTILAIFLLTIGGCAPFVSYPRYRPIRVIRIEPEEKYRSPDEEVVKRAERKKPTKLPQRKRTDIRKQRLVGEINPLIGTPYKWGGTTPNGFDCSGFVRYVYKRAYGINLPRTSKEMFKRGRFVSSYELATGDLVFFQSHFRGVDHVGIYIDDSQFVHASSHGVRKDTLELPYYKRRFIGGRRVIK